MGRFNKDRSNYRKSVILKQAGIISTANIKDEFDEDDAPEIKRRHSSGSLAKREVSSIHRLKSKLHLASNRLKLFTSPEFKRTRLVPDTIEPTTSTYGLLRTAVDPSYREATIGDIWLYSDGVGKHEIKCVLEKEADREYQRNKKLGEYSHGPSPLRNSALRRSARLAK